MGMKLRKGTAVAKAAHGRPLSSYKNAAGESMPEQISYDFEWHEYEDEQTMVDAKDELTLKEQRKVRNNERKTTARQAANTVALDLLGVVKPDMKNDPQLRLKSVYSGLYAQNVADGMDDETAKLEARKLASTLLKIEWADEED